MFYDVPHNCLYLLRGHGARAQSSQPLKNVLLEDRVHY